MIAGRKLLLIVLAVAVIVGGYYALSRMTGVVPWFGRSDQAETAQGPSAEEKAAAERRKAIAEARRRDLQKMLEQIPEDLKKPRTLTLNDFVTSQERFPLPDDATLLTTSPALPDKMPPLVFFAPLRNLQDKRTRNEEALEALIGIHLSANLSGKQLVDLPPTSLVAQACWPPMGQGEWTDRKPAEYFEIARHFGADIFVYGRADARDGQVMLQLGLSDLNVTRTDTLTVQVPLNRIGEAIAQAVSKIALFAGVAQADIDAAGMLQGLPGPATYEAILSDEIATPELLRKYFAVEPDSRFLHVWAPMWLNAPDSIDFANESLKRWPDDGRLLYSKCMALAYSGNHVAAVLFASALARRYGPSASLLTVLQDNTYEILKSRYAADSASIIATRKAFEDYLQRRPKCWQMRRLYALHLWNMAHYAPWMLTENASDTSESKSHLASQTYDLASRHLEEAAKGHAAPFILLKDMLRLKIRKGDPPESLMPILARIQLIDPKNIEGDLMVAKYVGERAPVGDIAYLDIIKAAVDRVGRSPQVMDDVTRAMQGPLSVTILPYNTKNYMRLKDRADALYYGEAMETALSDGRLVEYGQMAYFSYVIKANNGWVPKWKIYEDYVNRNLKKLKEALDAGRWEEGLKLSIAVGHLGGGDSEVFADYARVKCQWKLKRYSDALYLCDRFLEDHPNKHTFYYMFGIVAEEAGVRLEEAYEKAKIAIRLDPTNQGIKDLLARLGKRLGKPTTL